MNDIFFSGTFGGETASLAATKVVLEKIDTLNVPQVIATTGKYLLVKLDSLIKELNCESFLSTAGHPSWSFLIIANTHNYNNFEIKTLFMQEMLKRGVLTFGTHNISYSHTTEDIDFLLQSYREVFPIIKACIENNNLKETLECEPLVPLFSVR